MKLARGRLMMAWEHAGHWTVRQLLCTCCCFCIFLSVLLLLLFSSFAVLLDCPYPDPRVLPFSSNSPPNPSGGRGDTVTTWPFVASQGQTMTPICFKLRVFLPVIMTFLSGKNQFIQSISTLYTAKNVVNKVIFRNKIELPSINF